MRPLIRNIVYGFAEKYLLAALSLAASMFLARMLSPAQLGIYAIAAVLAGVAHVLRDLGTGQMLVAARTLERRAQQAYLALAIATGWSLAALLAAAAPWVADFYRQPMLCDVLRVIALNFLLVPFSSQVTAMLRRELRSDKIFRINAAYGFTSFGATIALAWLGLGPLALAWGSVAANGAGLLAALFVRPDSMAWRPTLIGVRPLVRPGVLAVGANVVDEFGVVAPELIAGKLLGAEEVALLGKAQAVVALFNQAVTSAVSPVVFPALARRAREDGDVLQAYLDATECITALSWPFFLAAALFAPALLHLLYGPQWNASVPLIRIICAGAAVYSMFSMSRHLLAATGNFAAQAQVDAHAVAFRILLLLPASMAGLQWVACAVAASLVFRSWLAYRCLRSCFGLSARLLAGQLRKSALVALAATLPGALLVIAAGPGEVGRQAMLGGLACGAACWGAALWLQRHPLAALLRGLRLQR